MNGISITLAGSLSLGTTLAIGSPWVAFDQPWDEVIPIEERAPVDTRVTHTNILCAPSSREILLGGPDLVERVPQSPGEPDDLRVADLAGDLAPGEVYKCAARNYSKTHELLSPLSNEITLDMSDIEPVMNVRLRIDGNDVFIAWDIPDPLDDRVDNFGVHCAPIGEEIKTDGTHQKLHTPVHMSEVGFLHQLVRGDTYMCGITAGSDKMGIVSVMSNTVEVILTDVPAPKHFRMRFTISIQPVE